MLAEGQVNSNRVRLCVELISAPSDLLRTIYVACRTCYSSLSPIEIMDKLPDEGKMLSLVEKVISSGHYSTIEHIQLSFAIRGISRACSHQLVRHRLMSFSQKSQRYVKEIEQFKYIIPSEIEKDPKLKERFEIYMSQIFEMYEYFISKGVKAQDARSVLPNAVETSMVASLNLRELIHLANIRLCSRAQEEIRYLVKEMVSLVNDKYPWLKKHLVPKCESLGFCDEDKSCGRKPIKGS